MFQTHHWQPFQFQNVFKEIWCFRAKCHQNSTKFARIRKPRETRGEWEGVYNLQPKAAWRVERLKIIEVDQVLLSFSESQWRYVWILVNISPIWLIGKLVRHEGLYFFLPKYTGQENLGARSCRASTMHLK